MLMKTSELQGAALDWAVTKCEGFDTDIEDGSIWGLWGWATDWAQGGPIIEREGLTLDQWDDYPRWRSGNSYGPTPLIAAMRCYVASKLGYEIDIPEELK
jgi:hypothetical protein